MCLQLHNIRIFWVRFVKNRYAVESCRDRNVRFSTGKRRSSVLAASNIWVRFCNICLVSRCEPGNRFCTKTTQPERCNGRGPLTPALSPLTRGEGEILRKEVGRTIGCIRSREGPVFLSPRARGERARVRGVVRELQLHRSGSGSTSRFCRP